MRLITIDDLIDVYGKISQRGIKFFFSKFTFNKSTRTKSAFNQEVIISSNFWEIPYVVERWNKLISGKANIDYREYFIDNYVKNKKKLKILSLGSGNCSFELELARRSEFDEIVCIDIAKNRLDEARKIAHKDNLNTIHFLCEDVYNNNLYNNYYDFVLFKASLHHFKNVNIFLSTKVKSTLKLDGMLVINEYVGANRLQYSKNQIKAINKGLKLIDKPFRKKLKLNIFKNKYYGSGIIRMIIADPSECIDSSSILPSLHNNFSLIEEKPYGGNILMGVLKDISYHFLELDNAKKEILDNLFELEDEFLESEASDFVFGVYQNKI